MLSLPKLVILAQQSQYDRLIDAVLRSGRPLPIPVRARLEDGENAPIAGLALAVQRYLELAARPTVPLAGLLGQLLEAVEAACSPVASPAASPAANRRAKLPSLVLAASALGEAEAVYQDASDRHARVSRVEAGDGDAADERAALLGRIQAVRAQVWHALACAQQLDPDGALAFGGVADAETTYLLLWQLNRLPEASEHLHLPLLIDAAFTMELVGDPRIEGAVEYAAMQAAVVASEAEAGAHQAITAAESAAA